MKDKNLTEKELCNRYSEMADDAKPAWALSIHAVHWRNDKEVTILRRHHNVQAPKSF